MANWEAWISELLNKTDLVGLVSPYVSLQKKGGTYWGCCPFHHERTPSFTVSESKGMFYCFGCMTGGNAITFLSKIESVPRIDAIKMLAEKARMTLPEGEFQRAADSEQIRAKKQRLLNLLRDSARHYHQNLSADSAKPATDYLAKRGITEAMVTRFGIGYSAGYDTLITHLKSMGYTTQEMVDAGVAAQKADRHYDVFAKRLIIPIVDMRGDVVSFGGRLLEDSDFAKYRNGSQTLVFDKSKNIFAINLVKRKKQKEGIKYIILAEGYMDVIALHKAGFSESAASMGTALTTQQARLIKNLTDNVYISFDGDSAGQKATLRGLDILQSEGLNVKVIVLPEGLDPDDVIKRGGAAEYKKLMQSALPLPAFKIESLKKSHDLTTPDGKSAFAVEAVRVVKTLQNPVEREEYLQIVQRATGYQMSVLYSQADLPEPETAPPPVALARKEETTDTIAEAREFVLAEIAANRAYANLSEDIGSLMDDKSREILSVIMEARSRPNYAPGQLYEFIDESDEPFINRLTTYQFKDGDGAEKYLACINKLKAAVIEKEINELIEKHKQTKDSGLLPVIQRLMQKKNELKGRPIK